MNQVLENKLHDPNWKEQKKKYKSSETIGCEMPVFAPPMNTSQCQEALEETKEELDRRGDFDLIFPNSSSKYDKYFHPSRSPLHKFLRENIMFPPQSLFSNIQKAKSNLEATINFKKQK